MKNILFSVFFTVIGFVSSAQGIDTLKYKLIQTNTKDVTIAVVKKETILSTLVISNDSLSDAFSLVKKQIFVFNGVNGNQLLFTKTSMENSSYETFEEIRLIEFNNQGKVSRNIQLYFGDIGRSEGFTPYYVYPTKKKISLIFHDGIITGVTTHKWFLLDVDRKNKISEFKETVYNGTRFDIFKIPNSTKKVVLGFKRLPDAKSFVGSFDKKITQILTQTINFEPSNGAWCYLMHYRYYFYNNKLWVVYDDNKYGTYVSVFDFSETKPKLLYNTQSEGGRFVVIDFDKENEKLIFKKLSDKKVTEDYKYIDYREGEKQKEKLEALNIQPYELFQLPLYPEGDWD